MLCLGMATEAPRVQRTVATRKLATRGFHCCNIIHRTALAHCVCSFFCVSSSSNSIENNVHQCPNRATGQWESACVSHHPGILAARGGPRKVPRTGRDCQHGGALPSRHYHVGHGRHLRAFRNNYGKIREHSTQGHSHDQILLLSILGRDQSSRSAPTNIEVL